MQLLWFVLSCCSQIQNATNKNFGYFLSAIEIHYHCDLCEVHPNMFLKTKYSYAVLITVAINQNSSDQRDRTDPDSEVQEAFVHSSGYH